MLHIRRFQFLSLSLLTEVGVYEGKKNKVEVQFVCHLPINVSSYSALPSALRFLNCLLNIRSPNDSNCFLYCIIATWHFTEGLKLHEKISTRLGTRSDVFKHSNLLAHQPVGNFVKPMGFHKTPGLEKINNVQGKSFRFQSICLNPLFDSKNKDDR